MIFLDKKKKMNNDIKIIDKLDISKHIIFILVFKCLF